MRLLGNLGFTALSALWHGIGSVLIPICIIHYLFPKSATVPWLPKYLTVFLGALLAFIGINEFFSPTKIQGTVIPFLTIIFSMTFLSLFALRFRRSTDAFFDATVLRPYLPFCLGLCVRCSWLCLVCLTALGVPLARQARESLLGLAVSHVNKTRMEPVEIDKVISALRLAIAP